MNFSLFYVDGENNCIAGALKELTNNSICILADNVGYEPYDDRIYIIIGNDTKIEIEEDYNRKTLYVNSVDKAFTIIDIMWERSKVFVLGMDLITNNTFNMQLCNEIYVCHDEEGEFCGAERTRRTGECVEMKEFVKVKTFYNNYITKYVRKI